MIETDDIRASVAAGILTERQAASLTALAHSRRGAREGLHPGDEPFELFKGFNEIFIIVGLLILSLGWAGLISAMFDTQIIGLRYAALWYGIPGAVVLWLLSEYFIWRRRMVGPAIALSILFAINAGATLIAYFANPFMIGQLDLSSLQFPLAMTTIAVAAFWLRFRVPFAMAMIAVSLFLVAMMAAAINQGSPESATDIFLLSAGGPFAWITLGLGIAIFAAAMAFDMSDPHRVTRRAANGFWLHVVAAPAMVNTIALSLIDDENLIALLAFLAVIAVIAMIIDRRSFLITAIGYVVAVAGTVFGGDGIATTILALGIILLILGAFWEKFRAQLLRRLPSFIPLHRLPPAQ
ncbi:hypothetical protein [Yoonia sp.]|uniref:hypothetical protein n=1 Tax=Yoonia sp. TaxID=2212373 RepID=UPI00238D430C|nr:hypothetical protein [Yoonia sp.]MDE0850970.1 hypothetical protein [Yoonia sp.]